jgi:hypothetical protein
MRFLRMFINNFQIYDSKYDELFGEIDFYQNKNNKKIEILVKTISFDQESDIEVLMNTMKSRLIHPIPNLLAIFHLEIISSQDFICANQKYLKIYIEYLEKSLKSELKRRKKLKGYYFSE